MKFAWIAVAAVAIAGPAAAAEVKVGQLQCEVSAGLGMIIASAKPLDCRFTPMRGRPEAYHGFIRRFGLDLGGTDRGVLTWDVYAPNARPPRKALAGDYTGIGAQATLGVGLGGNGLYDGARQIGLQPVSLRSPNGLNIAAGVAALELRPGT